MAEVDHDGDGDGDHRVHVAAGVAACSLSGVKRRRDAAESLHGGVGSSDDRRLGGGLVAPLHPPPPSAPQSPLNHVVVPSTVVRVREAAAREAAARAAGMQGVAARLVNSAPFHTPVAPPHPHQHGEGLHGLPPPPSVLLPSSARGGGGGAPLSSSASASSSLARPHGRASALAVASLREAEVALAVAVAGRGKAGAHPTFAELLRLRYTLLRPALMAAREAIAPSDAAGQALYSRLLASYRQAKAQLQRLGVVLGGHDGGGTASGGVAAGAGVAVA